MQLLILLGVTIVSSELWSRRIPINYLCWFISQYFSKYFAPLIKKDRNSNFVGDFMHSLIEILYGKGSVKGAYVFLFVPRAPFTVSKFAPLRACGFVDVLHPSANRLRNGGRLGMTRG